MGFTAIAPLPAVAGALGWDLLHTGRVINEEGTVCDSMRQYGTVWDSMRQYETV